MVACIVLTSISCFAQSTFFQVPSTPYDRQMTRIRPTLTSSDGRSTSRISMLTVNQWMNRLREIPYGFSRRWKTPAEVESATVADCKGKAMSLYKRMRAHGARNVRLVIGKYYVSDLQTHAWVEWQTTTGNYVLDPTFNSTATLTAQNSLMTYIPFYAYEGDRKYRAPTAPFAPQNLMANNAGRHWQQQQNVIATRLQPSSPLAPAAPKSSSTLRKVNAGFVRQ